MTEANITNEELKQFVERYEQLDSEEVDIKDQKKELKTELRGRGFDVSVFLAIIALRKKDPDDVSEFEALLETYKQALGMD